MTTPREVPLPEQSRVASGYAKADFADAFALDLPATVTADAETLARAMFERPAPWFRLLLGLRDAIVAPLGIRTSGALRNEALPASKRIDFFTVVSSDPDEIVLGEEDSHLDFRASVLIREAAQGREVVATTIVWCHNRTGRAYIRAIAPFHRLVVISALKRAAARGWA